MQSRASTVAEYLASLPPERRAALEAVRATIRANLAPGFEEGMQYGMIGYHVPHRLYPAGYHCDPRQPLPFAGLAAQKNHMAIYLFCIYGSAESEARFRAAWVKTGKKLDMGKSCIRFKKLDEVALDVLADTLRPITVEEFVAQYETMRPAGKSTRPAAAKTVADPTASSAAQRAARASAKTGARTAAKPTKRTAPKPATRAQRSGRTRGKRAARTK